MQDRDTGKNDEAAANFRAGRPYYDRRLLTSDKYIAGLNAGGAFLGDVTRVRMPIGESVANSMTGQFVRRVLSLRT